MVPKTPAKELQMKSPLVQRPRILAILALSFFAMAFTLPGCPDVDALNQRIADLEKKAGDNTKQVSELADTVRILNDEHNTVKQLVSQISSTVLEQKDALEKIDQTMQAKHAAPPPKAKSSSKSKSKSKSKSSRRRR
jgi:septal ring factor EnvC (AmiA/AmiB activator)